MCIHKSCKGNPVLFSQQAIVIVVKFMGWPHRSWCVSRPSRLAVPTQLRVRTSCDCWLMCAGHSLLMESEYNQIVLDSCLPQLLRQHDPAPSLITLRNILQLPLSPSLFPSLLLKLHFILLLHLVLFYSPCLDRLFWLFFSLCPMFVFPFQLY